jgi:hypothetical protein
VYGTGSTGSQRPSNAALTMSCGPWSGPPCTTVLGVHNCSSSLDGYVAGPGQDLDDWACVEFAPSAAVTHARLRRT